MTIRTRRKKFNTENYLPLIMKLEKPNSAQNVLNSADIEQPLNK